MDELLSEFLTETGEGLDQLDVELVRFEQEPNNAEMLNTIFRLVHTCLLYTSPSPRDRQRSRMPSSA